MDYLHLVAQAVDNLVNAPGTFIPANIGRSDGSIAVIPGGTLIYVTLTTGEVIEVINRRVPNDFRQHVLLGVTKEEPSTLQVLSTRDVFSAEVPVLPDHAQRHQWPYYDTLWVRGEQILPGLAVPEGMVVKILSTPYYLGGWRVLPNTSIDLTSSIPASGAVWASVEVDNAGVVGVRLGTALDERILLTPDYIPAPLTTTKMLVAVKLYAGQTEIQKYYNNTDVYDPRLAGSSGGGVDNATDQYKIMARTSPGAGAWEELSSSADIFSLLAAADYAGVRSQIGVDTDTTLAANSNAKIASQKAVKAYVDGAVGGGGGGLDGIHVDGALSIATNVTNAILITSDTQITAWYIYCKNTGSAGSTIVDINLNGTTIFTTQTNRPELAFDDVNGWAVSGLPDFVDFVEGDVITFDIDNVGTSAADLIVTPLGTATGAVVITGGPGASSPTLKIYMSDTFR